MAIDLVNEPRIGPLQIVTKDYQEVVTETSASAPDASYVLWHTPPEKDRDEAIFISRISDPGLGPQKIFEGADPDCLPTERGGYISWLRVGPETKTLSINLSTFTDDLRVTSTNPVATLRPGRLVTRPYLAEYNGEPCLVYSYRDDKKRPQIRTYFINSGATVEDVLPVQSLQDMIVRWSSRHLAAVIETEGEMTLLTFDGGRWKIITSIKKKGIPPNRFDFAVSDTAAMFIMEVASPPDGLAALAVDLSRGIAGETWPISRYGKFPGVAPADDYWVVSWVGSPAVPAEIQPTGEGEIEIDPHLKVLRQMAAEEEAREIETGVKRERSEIEELFGYTSVSPWAPLWLGVLSEEGKCLKSYGPLGGSADENWLTQLKSRGGRGVLLWRSNAELEDPGRCFLKAREIILPINLEH